MAVKKKGASVAQVKKAATDGRAQRPVRKSERGPKDRTRWLGMSTDEQQRVGATLLAWLYQTANARGLTLSELAEGLGVTYGYISQLKNGLRKTENISDTFADACSDFLGVPRLAVLIAAGRVRPSDFYTEPAAYKTGVLNAVGVIRQDPEWGPLLPVLTDGWDFETRQFITLLYERATGKKILPEAVDVEDLLARMWE